MAITGINALLILTHYGIGIVFLFCVYISKKYVSDCGSYTPWSYAVDQ